MRVLVAWVYGKHSLLPDASCSPLSRQSNTAPVAEGTKGDCKGTDGTMSSLNARNSLLNIVWSVKLEPGF